MRQTAVVRRRGQFDSDLTSIHAPIHKYQVEIAYNLPSLVEKIRKELFFFLLLLFIEFR